MESITQKIQRDNIDLTDFVDMVAYRHQRHNVTGTREMLGDQQYLAIMERYAGAYIRFPTTKRAFDIANDLHLLSLYERMQECSKAKDGNWKLSNAQRLLELRRIFESFGQRMGLAPDRAVVHARKVQRERDNARTWLWGLREQAKKPRMDPF